MDYHGHRKTTLNESIDVYKATEMNKRKEPTPPKKESTIPKHNYNVDTKKRTKKRFASNCWRKASSLILLDESSGQSFGCFFLLLVLSISSWQCGVVVVVLPGPHVLR